MRTIGITGISGAGKTTISEQICKLKNAKHINADKIAKDLTKSGSGYYKEVVEKFGDRILKENKEINRKKLADLIFSDKAEKGKLDKITYKHIVPKIEEEISNAEGYDTVVIDAPLLFEAGLNKICDVTIGVVAEKETCIKRVMGRDKINENAATDRINSQKNQTFFKINCDYCIYNEIGSDIETQIKEILEGKNLSNKNVIHVYNNGVEYLQFRKLLEYEDKVKHCYTLKPLDFGKFQIRKDEVLEQYKRVCQFLNINEKNIYKPLQCHTDVVKSVNYEEPGIHKENFKNIDGFVTSKKDKVLALTFADCNCLYFYDPVKNAIGNVHAGWRGTHKEIARESVKVLKEEYGCNPKDLICIMAPSIRKCCFEVDEDVKEMFESKFKYTGRIDEIIQKSDVHGKYYIDTQLINRIILEEEGMLPENIIESEICTKCNSNKLHSYRSEGELVGRNTSVICLI